MKIKMIVAVDNNGAIGKNNELCWSLPSDMKNFKMNTEGHVVVMGRKTWESLPKKFQPLPNRQNVIVSNSIKNISTHENTLVFSNIKDVFDYYTNKDIENQTDTEIWFIGGSGIYNELINSYFNKINEMVLTFVDMTIINPTAKIHRDTLSNKIGNNRDLFESSTVLEQKVNKHHNYNFTILKFTRKHF